MIGYTVNYCIGYKLWMVGFVYTVYTKPTYVTESGVIQRKHIIISINKLLAEI